jgi:UDP-GlcNAc3NAcA epimerase
VPPNNIEEVGDVMLEVSKFHSGRVGPIGGVLTRLDLSPRKYILATVHRAENTDNSERLFEIMKGLEIAAETMPVILPLHPRTKRVLQLKGWFDVGAKGVITIDPIGYLDMVQLEKYAAVIATDSGGVQKEAYFHQVPCVTLRDETEWVELIDSGWNCLVGAKDRFLIADSIIRAVGRDGLLIDLYGSGNAALKILNKLF